MRTDAIERRWSELAPLFDAAADLDGNEREAFVGAVADAELRDALRVLLGAAQRSGALDTDRDVAAARLLDASEGIEGRRLGAWQVGPKIGSGGMATVFRARRADGAFEQEVAIKMLRHGLLDAWERERFLRERGLLARLRHPDIAHVIDGGLTPEGVPWFAMEYVDGLPVTAYCDAHSLDVTARVRLFERLCAAVDHAHRSLVVHRDLKPSNILVTADGAPRLLDFGIAKLIGDASADEQTQTVARRMTPAYAAPEQTSGGAITTATDVYALGVLLHELLTGTRPQHREDGSLRNPSSTITGPAATAHASARADTPRGLRRRLSGELDLIVAHALAEDPAQRYAGAAELADDLARWRTGRPIRARPDAAGYRLRKFAWRNRRALAIAAMLVLVLLVGVAATWWQARVARIAAARADATRDFVLSLFAGVTPDEARGRDVGARELLDRGAARLAETLHETPAAQSTLATALAGAYRQLGGFERAHALAVQGRDSASDATQRTRALIELGQIEAAEGNPDAAEAALREAIAIAPTALAVDARLRLAEVASDLGREDALALADEALAEARESGDDALVAQALGVLGAARFRASEIEASAEALREALALQRKLHGEAHTSTARAMHDLGVVVLQQGGAQEAAELFEGALGTREALLGKRHPDVADSRFNLGIALRRLGQPDRAGAMIDEAVAMQRELLGPIHPLVATGINSQAMFAIQRGDLVAGERLLGDALESARGAYGDRHSLIITLRNNLGSVQRALGRLDEAEATARKAVADATAGLGDSHYLAGIARFGLGATLLERGMFQEAATELAAARALIEGQLGADHADALNVALVETELALLRDDVDAARSRLATVEEPARSVPAGHPRIGKLNLLRARVAARDGRCSEADFAAAASTLARGGAMAHADLALARLGRARCLDEAGDHDQAATEHREVDALAQALPYVPRALRQELARAD